MRKLNTKVNNRLSFVYAGSTTIAFIVIVSNLVDFYIKFKFELTTLTSVYYVTAFVLRGILWTIPLVFGFFTYNIYLRYNLLNDHLR